MDGGELIGRDLYFAPVVAALVARNGELRDLNIAARVLFDVDVWQKQIVPDALTLPKSADATWIATDDRSSRVSCAKTYDSTNFGRVELLLTRLPIADDAAVDSDGWYVFGESGILRDGSLARQALHRRWCQESLWSLYAASYDRVLLEMPYYQEVIGRHVAATVGDDVRRVLDLGAGTGNVTLDLIGHGKKVTAVDSSRAMLARLREKWDRSFGSDLTVLERNAEHLDDLRGESFDAISILLSLYDMDRPARALDWAVELLGEGGTLVITEPRRAFRLGAILDEVERVLRLKNLLPELEPDWGRVRDVNVALDPSRDRQCPRSGRLFAEDIVRLLSDRGLEIVSVLDSHLGNCATIVAKKSAVRDERTSRPRVNFRAAG